MGIVCACQVKAQHAQLRHSCACRHAPRRALGHCVRLPSRAAGAKISVLPTLPILVQDTRLAAELASLRHPRSAFSLGSIAGKTTKSRDAALRRGRRRKTQSCVVSPRSGRRRDLHPSQTHYTFLIDRKASFPPHAKRVCTSLHTPSPAAAVLTWSAGQNA